MKLKEELRQRFRFRIHMSTTWGEAMHDWHMLTNNATFFGELLRLRDAGMEGWNGAVSVDRSVGAPLVCPSASAACRD